ncbi:MAG: hypothetical protein SNJ74_06570 [Fimbriimonadaceae bacterium]
MSDVSANPSPDRPSFDSGSAGAHPPKPPGRDHWYVIGCAALFLGIVVLTVGPLQLIMGDVGKNQLDRSLTATCKARLALLARSAGLYAADYDDRLPPADAWVDATWNYVGSKAPEEESESPFRCPSISILRKIDQFGYAFDSTVGGEAVSVALERSEPIIFDSDNLVRNAHESAPNWPEAKRHARGTENYGVTLSGTLVTQ